MHRCWTRRQNRPRCGLYRAEQQATNHFCGAPLAGSLGGLLAAAPGLAPPGADAASHAKRCRRKHGVFVNSGECRCAAQCSTPETRFPCHDNKHCSCGETLAGEGFCALSGSVNNNGCSPEAGAECLTGFTCVVNRGCVASGGTCTTKADCPTPSYGCVDGQCEQTFCTTACPM
jgi:hypothetical protein